jgi:hypothetical protein
MTKFKTYAIFESFYSGPSDCTVTLPVYSETISTSEFEKN